MKTPYSVTLERETAEAESGITVSKKVVMQDTEKCGPRTTEASSRIVESGLERQMLDQG